MYKRKIPVDLECPLRLTMSLIGSKWKSCILDELRYKPLRPSELHKIFPEATPRVLDLQLKELVNDGLVFKTIYPELPPRSEYTLTSLGQTLIPIIDAMIEWGNEPYKPDDPRERYRHPANQRFNMRAQNKPNALKLWSNRNDRILWRIL